jgi:hypothetical protein
MKICVVSLYDDNYQELADITLESNCREYCEKHNYDCYIKKDNFILKHLGFEKIRLLLELLKTNKYDWIYWRGADTLITNFQIKLENLIDENYHFLISLDVHGINSDSLFIKNSPQGIKLFENILDYKDSAPEEQIVIRHIYESNQHIIKLVPQKFMNSYNYSLYLSQEPWNVYGIQPESTPNQDQLGYYGSWDVGDFLLHWPGIRNDKRIELAKYYTNQIIK